MSKVFVFATAGRTDIKVAFKIGDVCYRSEIDEGIREFHEYVLSKLNSDNFDKYFEFSEKQADCQNLKGYKIIWNFVRNEFELVKLEKKIDKNVLNRTEKLESNPVFLFDGKIMLFPAKIYKIEENIYFNSVKCSSKKKTVTLQELKKIKTVAGAVVLNTRRNEKFKNEPIACGPLISLWLSRVFDGLEFGKKEGNVGEGTSGWIDILSEEMKSSGEGRDFPVNREMIRRIDKTVVNITKINDISEVHYFSGGGIPETKEQLKSILSYRFGKDRVVFWHDPEYSLKDSTNYLLDNETPLPSESFRARENAEKLILKGDFSGAYAAVGHLSEDDSEASWVEVIKQTASFFSGVLEEKKDTPPYLKDIISFKNSRSLMVGLRLEAALLSERFLEAISLTFTFADASLIDLICEMEGVKKLDERYRDIHTSNDNFLEKALSYFINNSAKSEEKDKQPLKHCKKGHWQYDTNGKNKEKWAKFLSEVCHKNSISSYISIANNNQFLKDVRNIITHSSIESRALKKAIDIFHEIGLWNKNETSIGCKFLSQKHATSVLNELGFDNPSKIYHDIVNGVKQKLRSHIIE